MPHVPRRIANKLRRAIGSIHRVGALNSELITLRWVERVIPEGYLPDVETSPRPVVTPRVDTKRAFVHTAGINTTGFVRHAVISVGDVILDFPEDVDLKNKTDLQFEFGGTIYVQKDCGRELEESWDVRCNGVTISRTVLVTPKS